MFEPGVADVVRPAVKDHFGPRDEKVAEFGVQPFRGRKAKTATEIPAVPFRRAPGT